MLITWILLSVSVGLFLISTYKLFLFYSMHNGSLVEATVDQAIVNTYPMKLTSGRAEHELIVRYSYFFAALKYSGVDRFRTNNTELFNRKKADIKENSKIFIKVSSYSPEISSLFFDGKYIVAAILLICTSGFLACWLFFYI